MESHVGLCFKWLGEGVGKVDSMSWISSRNQQLPPLVWVYLRFACLLLPQLAFSGVTSTSTFNIWTFCNFGIWYLDLSQFWLLVFRIFAVLAFGIWTFRNFCIWYLNLLQFWHLVFGPLAIWTFGSWTFGNFNIWYLDLWQFWHLVFGPFCNFGILVLSCVYISFKVFSGLLESWGVYWSLGSQPLILVSLVECKIIIITSPMTILSVINHTIIRTR